MALALMGLSVRAELAGMTSFVRALGFAPAAYRNLLHLFHSQGLEFDRLSAQGLLQHLAVNRGTAVWRHFRSWMRTMNPSGPPSEAIVAEAPLCALRAALRLAG